ncbi:hypothetical protein NC652_027652 [Populus alba x Populus x berolinensis]|nr:hypothetical protein NC652_027652 [Populus alba x Populus x berolinensis]
MSKKFNQKKKEEEIAKMVFLLRLSRCEKYKVDAPLASMATVETYLTASKVHPLKPILATLPLKKNGDDTQIIPLVIEDL